MAARRRLALLEAHQRELRACTRCPQMVGPVVHGAPVLSKVMLIGQAPGPREGQFGRPFAWTAGKRLFEWLGTQGLDEEAVRERVYIAAVCRCFPGKQPGKKPAGDRVPAPDEIANCAPFIRRELELLEPDLLLPVGRLAIEQVLGKAPLAEIIGRVLPIELGGRRMDVIPLPHPSGASTWFRVEPGKTLTEKALQAIGKHPAWRALRR